MRVTLVNLAQPPGTRTAEEVLAGAFVLVDWAEALTAAGAEVTAIQGSAVDESWTREGVRYELVAGPFEPFLHPLRIHLPILDRLVRTRPDVVHLNSLLYGRQLHHARRRLPDSAFVLQHHAERPSTGRLRCWLQRRWLRTADAFVWNGLEMARPWRARGLLPEDAPDDAVAEGSVRFKPAADRRRLRKKLGFDGDPLILWLGNLDTNKDPLTVLAGLEPVLSQRAAARVVFCFKGGDLESTVRQHVASSEVLARAVRFRGHVPYQELEPIVQAADILVQGSHHEGSSFALIEAFACGVIPVFTDIPSIRFLAAGAAETEAPCAFLWAAADAIACKDALTSALGGDLAHRQKAARNHFDRHLDYPVLARRMLDVYHRAIVARRARG